MRRGAIAAVCAFVIVGAAFVVLGLVVRDAARPTGWEDSLIRAAHRHPPPWAHRWATLFDRNPFALITLALAAVALLTRRWPLAVAGTLGCLVAVVAAEHVFKHLIEDDYPSAHVTAAAACATFAWCLLSKRRVVRLVGLVVFVIPLIVAWALVERGVHLPADAIGGLLLGPLAVGAVVFATATGIVLLSKATPTEPASASRPPERTYSSPDRD